MICSDLKAKKILVTGGAGFLGAYVVRKLIALGVDAENIEIPRSKTMDLRSWENCQKAVKDKDVVIHLAGTGGGIGFNQKYPGSIIFNNIMMGVQLMEAARKANIEKFVTIGTVCSYPKFARVPFREEELWDGYPEPTNGSYGMSKKILLVQGQAYRQEYSFNSIHLLVVNLYGPGDDFSPKSSHVVPALIKKMEDSKQSHVDEVVLWGTGRPSREFLYVEDAADGICAATTMYDKEEPVNLGSGAEIRISELAKTIANLTHYEGSIIWDNTKPDGQARRLLDTSRGEREFGFKAKTPMLEGLTKTIEWYYANRERLSNET